jgi:hypothetical protein
MYAYSDSGLNRILWQVVESRAATVLKEPTDAVRKKVIADCRILDSYKTEAFRAADRIAKAAGTLGLEAAAKNAKLESVVTSPTSRITARSQRDMIRQSIMQQAFMRGMPEGVTIQEYMRQIQAYADSLSVMYRPHDYPPSMIEGVELQSLAASKRFVDRAFELARWVRLLPYPCQPLGRITLSRELVTRLRWPAISRKPGAGSWLNRR